MTCRPLHSSTPEKPILDNPLPSLNTPPKIFSQESSSPVDAYLCDSGEDLKRFLQGASLRPALSSSKIFSPASLASLLPPHPPQALDVGGIGALAEPRFETPESRFAKILYEIFTQLEDFELQADLKVPAFDKEQKRHFETKATLVLGAHGRVERASVTFDPALGPQPFGHPVTKVLSEIPLVGIFGLYRILKIEMDPDTRRLSGRVAYLFFPFSVDLQKTLVEKGKIPPDLLQGPGYDLHRGLPEYPWQISEFAEKFIQRRKEAGLAQLGKSTGLSRIVPLFDRGEVTLTGDFSNQALRIQGSTLKFFPKKPGEPHRLVLRGSLTHPVLKVWGLKSLEMKTEKGEVRLVQLEDPRQALEIHFKIDSQHPLNSTLEIPQSNSPGFQLQVISAKDPEQSLDLTLKKGFTLKGLRFQLSSEGPRMGIEEIEARQVQLEGMGVRFFTSPEDKTKFRDVEFSMKGGDPQFSSRIEGEASGEVGYSKGGEELAWMSFKKLAGEGALTVAQEEDGRDFFQLVGNFSTHIPLLRLLVKSEELKAVGRTEVEEADVSGRGSLKIWPKDFAAHLKGLKEGDSIKVSGRGGKVWAHQDTSEVPTWTEMKKYLGARGAEKMQTDLTIEIKEIGFEIKEMELQRILQAHSKKPALEILDTTMGPIHIRGDIYGKIITRLPGGIYHFLDIPEAAKMVDSEIRLGGLRDWLSEGKRNVAFSEIFISGEESKPTLSPFDQKRCGFDRQHIHASLGLFQFSTTDREIQLQQFGEHFHLYLKNPPFLGGCLKMD